MGAGKEVEDLRDKIREDIRQEIMNGGNKEGKGNRYRKQIEELEMSGGAAVASKTYSDKTKEVRSSFVRGYAYFCGVLLILSVLFLNYVWRSIKLYETTRPENLLDAQIQELQRGESADKIMFPSLAKNEFSSEEEMKDSYLESLQNSVLTYRFIQEDYQSGERMYSLYADEKAVAKITLQTVSEQNRLGFLHISQMEVAKIEPIMDIMTWSYDITVFDEYQVLVNDIPVSEKYQTEAAKDITEFAYLYEYVDMPRKVTYHIDGIYQEAEIQIVDEAGEEIPYQSEGNQISALLSEVEVLKTIPEEIASEIDVLQAAETWSKFTTRDLQGAYYGLEQARQYFIKDSYYWQKLGEYARGIDITLVSDHNAFATYFTEENVTDYRAYGETCFSCNIHFKKHMQLTIGREQVDTTDSIFYFVKLDDTEDGVHNPTWKIADIQAVVNPTTK